MADTVSGGLSVGSLKNSLKLSWIALHSVLRGCDRRETCESAGGPITDWKKLLRHKQAKNPK
jgi:hypothetical protein